MYTRLVKLHQLHSKLYLMGCGHQMYIAATTDVCPLLSYLKWDVATKCTLLLPLVSAHCSHSCYILFHYIHSAITLCSIPLIRYVPFRYYITFHSAYYITFHSAIRLCSTLLLCYAPFRYYVTFHSTNTLQSIPLLCYVPFRYYVALNANYSQTAKRNSN